MPEGNPRTAAVIGAGSIGCELVNQLADQGTYVKVLTRNPDAFTHTSPLVTVHKADVTDFDSLVNGLLGAQDVYNTAASFNHGLTFGRAYREARATNVRGTYNVRKAAEVTGGNNVILFSSEAASGPEGDYAEQSPSTATGIYGVTKAEGEMVFLDGDSPIKRSVVRPVSVLGPGATKWSSLLAEKVSSGIPLGIDDGSGIFRFVDIRDVAGAAIAVAQHPDTDGEIYNLAADRGIRMAALLSLYGELVDQDPRYIPGWLALTGALIGERAYALVGKTPPLDSQMVRTGLQKDRRVPTDKIKGEVGYQFIPPEQTIHETILWVNDAHQLGKDDMIEDLRPEYLLDFLSRD